MKAILCVMLVLLSGCAEYRALIATNSSEGADVALESAEWLLCKGATGGALERRYNLFSNQSGPKAKGWTVLCHGAK